jgi:ubiquinone biosynthesis protein
LVNQLERILHEEIDYKFEAQNILRAWESSRYFKIMKVPRLYPDLSSRCVLTMEFLEGIWMNEILEALRDRDQARLERFEDDGLRLALVARRIFEIGMRQIFEVGNFHADPHAANIVILPENVVGYVDFGIVGEMDDELASAQSRYLEAVKDRRIGDAARALSEVVVVPSRLQEKLPEFRTMLAEQVRDWLDHVTHTGSSLRDKSIAQLLMSNIALIRKFGFQLMDNTMRYYRALLIADVIILQLDPAYDMVRSLKHYFSRRQIRMLRSQLSRESIIQTDASYLGLWLRGPEIVGQFTRFLRSQEEGLTLSTSRLDLLYGETARFSFFALIAVLVVRIFQIKNLQPLVGFNLDWRLAAFIFFTLWRGARILSR